MFTPKKSLKIVALLSFLLGSVLAFSQNTKQEELEARRQELRLEIQKITQLRNENKSKEKSQLNLIQSFQQKIKALDNLIKVTNQQANFLTLDINRNQRKITELREELKVLKADYAEMMVKSYKSKNQQSKIMFLLSADDFKQAYKRLQYMKQYTDHQKQQGETIKVKSTELQATNVDLLKQQEAKKKLIAENREVQKTLEEERKQHEELMKSIKKNLSMYAAQIKQKQQEADRIDAEIDRIIKEAIAKSNKKAGVSNAKTASNFALTAEEKILAASFVANKGKLPWPVEKGYVTLGYGTQPHPLDKSLTIKSNGVRIATEKGAKVRAVFNGEVSSVLKMKNVNPIVMIRHGDYLTLYKNLSSVYVKEGDKVTTKQVIGEVFTNPANGETILSFSISKGIVTENPASWVFKM
ncbi:murein hydrolase activator EnvC family protein [Mariniflexile maritimum]|jgi:septal ring factor EnvC (AmiA/AmiB activator)|uniref:murein hydrolase activator EnvC family protein n=1 Tax=Mariniflexile maritimum TaxID=2682493 RepID=UPI0012F68799|nr:peptidoglycan DD-metalloendopeptidase family protein [Mariniflexile maritimum]MCB0448714.1 peptidoglycan DD-metalloendopeptidase family protein [Confluentibacter sp.]HMQ42812.1 peptidoglycan DD-metalloendopeptidase family protein [Mariniflexile sp.]HMR15149.1 peptidoglycan DD-metalloendopeptidase family protein [Mariniflexile sp.]